MHESIDFFSIVLPIEASDVFAFLVNFALDLVFLNVKVCRVFIFNKMVLLHRENGVVCWRAESLPKVNIVWFERRLVQWSFAHWLPIRQINRRVVSCSSVFSRAALILSSTAGRD